MSYLISRTRSLISLPLRKKFVKEARRPAVCAADAFTGRSQLRPGQRGKQTLVQQAQSGGGSCRTNKDTSSFPVARGCGRAAVSVSHILSWSFHSLKLFIRP